MEFLKNLCSFLGMGDYFTLVDTAGFGDSEGREENNRLLEGMLDVLKNDLKEASTLLILLRGDMTRFSYAFQQVKIFLFFLLTRKK